MIIDTEKSLIDLKESIDRLNDQYGSSYIMMVINFILSIYILFVICKRVICTFFRVTSNQFALGATNRKHVIHHLS
ncbi:TPA_asm: P6 [Scutellaria alphacytorhabdovirus 1]|nr:TPA_asm: P6 [Scutellaria alphacytorhabdovirus 1]